MNSNIRQPAEAEITDVAPELDLQQFLPYRFNRLAERISASLSNIYRERFSVSVPEWRVLAWLSQRESLTATDICQRAYMDKATVSRAIQKLQKRGLLLRTPSEEDQRGLVLSLTPAGESLLAELFPKAHDWEARLVNTLTAHEYRDLLHLLGKLERQLTRMEEQDAAEDANPDADVE